MKRIFIVCVILSLIAPITIEAKKKAFGNGLYWELSEDGTLTISGNGRMPDYGGKKNKCSPWYSKSKNIKEVVIMEGITTIGDYSFCSYTTDKIYSIETIRIPNSVTSIGNHAFSGCSSLRSIVIPNSVTSIGNGAFSGCI